jgi:hypothetical protein
MALVVLAACAAVLGATAPAGAQTKEVVVLTSFPKA